MARSRRLIGPCKTPGCGQPEHTNGRCVVCAARLGRTHHITVVCGPPCSGKTTYVREHAEPGDLIVDMDALYQALSPTTTGHDQPQQVRPYVFAARDAVTNLLLAGSTPVRAAWIITSAPTADARATWQQLGARVVLTTAPTHVLEHRIRTQRPTGWLDHLDRWLSSHTTGAVDETVTTG